MTHQEWLTTGLDKGWLEPHCFSHDVWPSLTTAEQTQIQQDEIDHCVFRYIVPDPPRGDTRHGET
jgi:hypothetical protein